MSFVTPDGVKAEVGRPVTKDPKVRDRAKAIQMANLRDLGWSLREIAGYFGTNHMKVKRSIAAIPPKARRHFEQTLGRLDAAG